MGNERPARPAVPRARVRVPAPEELPITEELRRWIAAHVPGLLEVSGFDLTLEVQRCLQYHRAHKPTVRYPLTQWYEVVKLRLLWLYQQARAPGRRTPSAVSAPAPAPPDEVPSYLRPPPSGDDRMPIEQVHALVADFLGPRTVTSPRPQEHQHRRESPQKGTPSKLVAERGAPTQDRGQILARSRSAARMMDAGLRALNAGAMDEAAYQTLLQVVRTGTAIQPALAGIIARFDMPAERHGSNPAAAD